MRINHSLAGSEENGKVGTFSLSIPDGGLLTQISLE